MAGAPITSVDELEHGIYELFRAYALTADQQIYGSRGSNRATSRAITDILAANPPAQNPNPRLVTNAFGFWGVEKILPDYIKQISGLIRDSAGRSFFLHKWGGEEAIHALAIEEWLRCVGAIDTAGVVSRYKDIVSTRWDPVNHPKAPINPATNQSWFAEARYGNAYVTLQEWMTWLGYRWLAIFAKRCGQPAFADICTRLAGEEAKHHRFFFGISQLLMRHRPTEYTEIFRMAFQDFAMPGKYVLDPADKGAYDEWSNVAAQEAVIPAPPIIQRRYAQSEQRTSRILSTTTAELQQLRADIWREYVTGVTRIFEKLEIPVPNTLRSAVVTA